MADDFIQKAVESNEFNNGGISVNDTGGGSHSSGPDSPLSARDQSNVEVKLEAVANTAKTNEGMVNTLDSNSQKISKRPPCSDGGEYSDDGCCGNRTNPFFVLNINAFYGMAGDQLDKVINYLSFNNANIRKNIKRTQQNEVSSDYIPKYNNEGEDAGCGCFIPFLSVTDLFFAVPTARQLGQFFTEAMGFRGRMLNNIRRRLANHYKGVMGNIVGHRNNPARANYRSFTRGISDEHLEFFYDIVPGDPAYDYYKKEIVRGFAIYNAGPPQNVVRIPRIVQTTAGPRVFLETRGLGLVTMDQTRNMGVVTRGQLNGWFDLQYKQLLTAKVKLTRNFHRIQSDFNDAVEIGNTALADELATKLKHAKIARDFAREESTNLIAQREVSMQELQAFDNFIEKEADALYNSNNGWGTAIVGDTNNIAMTRFDQATAGYHISNFAVDRGKYDLRREAAGLDALTDGEWSQLIKKAKQEFPASTHDLVDPSTGDVYTVNIPAGHIVNPKRENLFLVTHSIPRCKIAFLAIVGFALDTLASLMVNRRKTCYGPSTYLNESTCECECIPDSDLISCAGHDAANKSWLAQTVPDLTSTSYLQKRLQDIYEIWVPGFFPTTNEMIGCRSCSCDLIPSNFASCLCDSCPSGSTWINGNGCHCGKEYNKPPLLGYAPGYMPGIGIDIGKCVKDHEITEKTALGKSWNPEVCDHVCQEGTHVGDKVQLPTGSYARLEDNYTGSGGAVPTTQHYLYQTGCNFVCDGRDYVGTWPPTCGATEIFDSNGHYCACRPCTACSCKSCEWSGALPGDSKPIGSWYSEDGGVGCGSEFEPDCACDEPDFPSDPDSSKNAHYASTPCYDPHA